MNALTKTMRVVLLGEIPVLTFLLYILIGVMFWGAILLYGVLSLARHLHH